MPKGNSNVDCRPFSRKVNCFIAEGKFSAWNMLELVSYGKFCFSTSDLDRNKPTKGKLKLKA